jgi:Fic family protein
MQGLISDAGKLRSRNVGVLKGDKVTHMAPKHTQVEALLDRLFVFLKKDIQTPLLIKSCIFHYELEFIHPFIDGNGRIGRLWQTIILAKHNPVFEYIPLESLIKKKQKTYYHVLGQCDAKGNSTLFIEFMLKIISEELKNFLKTLSHQPQTPQSRLARAQENFKDQKFSRKEYRYFHKSISTATASRDLAYGVKHKILKKMGQKVLSSYQFI